jgi:hypothetical protein
MTIRLDKRIGGLILASTLLAAPAFAQPATSDGGAINGGAVASQPVPDTAATSPGLPSDQSVNPAPGAAGPYVGDGRKNFYDVDARIADVQQKIASLPASQRHKAMAGLKSIKSEEATQRARHGELRDWDRENLNHRLDQLAQAYPALASDRAAMAAR